jgi:deoxyribonuclease-4
MGVEPFRFILQDRRFDHVPMILETPKGLEEGVELDAINLATLCRLEGKAGKQRTTRKSPSRMN